MILYVGVFLTGWDRLLSAYFVVTRLHGREMAEWNFEVARSLGHRYYFEAVSVFYLLNKYNFDSLKTVVETDS